MLSEKFEKNVLILELPYNIGICTNIAHAHSLHPRINTLVTHDLNLQSDNLKLLSKSLQFFIPHCFITHFHWMHYSKKMLPNKMEKRKLL